jgi:hypothetical protein
VFNTQTRSEDLGTSHQYIPHSVSVYLCIYVASGIAKKSEDFLEALYRWSAGPLELFWISLCHFHLFKHYLYVAAPVTITCLACFAANGYWYYIYLFMLVIGLCKVLS